MVKLLAMSTTVFTAAEPKRDGLAGRAEYVGIGGAVDGVGHEQAAEEKHFGGQEDHMPSEAVSRCCSSVLYCPDSSPVRCTRAPLKFSHLRARVKAHVYCQTEVRAILVVVRLPRNFGRDIEIFR